MYGGTHSLLDLHGKNKFKYIPSNNSKYITCVPGTGVYSGTVVMVMVCVRRQLFVVTFYILPSRF